MTVLSEIRKVCREMDDSRFWLDPDYREGIIKRTEAIVNGSS